MTTAQPLISLPRDEIHLWFSRDVVDDRIKANGCRLLLTADERYLENRFKFEKDRNRYLVTRAIVRTVLSRYEAVDPRAWVFSVNSYGRPDVNVSSMGIADLSFNLSHTDGLIVVGVARKRALGVDVESVCTRESPLDMAKYVFATSELNELGGLPTERQTNRFFEYWTFKESYIKARGMGVSIPLQKFRFRLEQEGVLDFEIDPELADDPDRWQFWQIRPSDTHVIAICSERVGERTPSVVVRKITSLCSEEVLSVQFHRISRR